MSAMTLALTFVFPKEMILGDFNGASTRICLDPFSIPVWLLGHLGAVPCIPAPSQWTVPRSATPRFLVSRTWLWIWCTRLVEYHSCLPSTTSGTRAWMACWENTWMVKQQDEVEPWLFWLFVATLCDNLYPADLQPSSWISQSLANGTRDHPWILSRFSRFLCSTSQIHSFSR